MLTGGVPYYLASIEKGRSAVQIIEKLAFNEKGVLFEEFDHLFASLFDHADSYIQIIKTIASQPSGVGQREILKALGKSAMGGVDIKKLEELEETGFILSFIPRYHKQAIRELLSSGRRIYVILSSMD